MKKVFCQQTHSANIKIVNNKNFKNLFLNCDGLITSLKNVSINIKTADCLPIIIKSDYVVGVVHAGWRGLKNNIVSKAIKLIKKEFNIDPADLKIKIGPSIDKNNYFVKSDVYDIFKNRYSKFFEETTNGQWKMDLKGICVYQLVSSGVLVDNISLSKVSTFENKRYPSYRRDGKTEGFITSVMLK